MNRYELLISGFIRTNVHNNKLLFWRDLLGLISDMHSNEFIALINTFKQGWILKKSKHLKIWKKRWVKLSMGKMQTYKCQSCNSKPTQVIDLKMVSSVNTASDGTLNGFIVHNDVLQFEFIAKNEGEKWHWIKRIAESIILIHYQHQQQILNQFHRLKQQQ